MRISLPIALTFAVLASLVPSTLTAQDKVTPKPPPVELKQVDIDYLNEKNEDLIKLSPFAGLTRPNLDDLPVVPKPPARFCSEEEKAEYAARFKESEELFNAIGTYRGALDDRARDLAESLTTEKASWSQAYGPGPYPDPLGLYLFSLKGRLDHVQFRAKEYQDVFTRARDQLPKNGANARAALDVKVVPCDAPVFGEVQYPSVPSKFCKDEEKAAARELLTATVATADKNYLALKAWADELSVRESMAPFNMIVRLSGEALTARENAERAKKVADDLHAEAAKFEVASVGQCIDPCLVGTWRGTGKFFGYTVTFTPDGTQTIDYTNSAKDILANGDELSWSGVGENVIRTDGGIAEVQENHIGDVVHTVVTKNETLEMPWPNLGFAGLGETTGINFYICMETAVSYEGSTHVDRHPNINIMLEKVQ